MVRVENPPGLGDIDRLRLGRRPGQFQQPVEIAADHAVLGGGFRRALQPPQLFARLGLDLLRHGGLVDGRAQLGDLLAGALILAEFALDRRQLLAQHRLALTLTEGGLGLAIDLGRKSQNLEPRGQQLADLVQARLQVDGFEDVLFFLRLGVEIGRRQVRQGGRGRQSLDRLPQLFGQLRDQRHGLYRLLLDVQEPGLDLRAGPRRLGYVQAARLQIRFSLDHLGDPEPLHALADQVVLAVGPGHIAQHIGDHAHLVQIGRTRLDNVRIALQHDQDLALFAHGLLRRGHRLRATDRDRGHDVGKEHHVAHGNDQQGVGRRGRSGGLRGWSGGGGLFGHGVHPILRRLMTRQPLISCRETWS